MTIWKWFQNDYCVSRSLRLDTQLDYISVYKRTSIKKGVDTIAELDYTNHS